MSPVVLVSEAEVRTFVEVVLLVVEVSLASSPVLASEGKAVEEPEPEAEMPVGSKEEPFGVAVPLEDVAPVEVADSKREPVAAEVRTEVLRIEEVVPVVRMPVEAEGTVAEVRRMAEVHRKPVASAFLGFRRRMRSR